MIGNQNNFDLLRLFAAMQVALSHAMSYLDNPISFLVWMSALPGVPIFFFLSGLLIYGSYKSSLSSETPLKTFYKKRILRLYPGLWVCFIFSVFLLFLSGYMFENPATYSELFFWTLTQVSFLQYYQPEFLYAFGTGAVNAALWTIVVEIQFYLLFPLVYRLLHCSHIKVLLVLSIFMAINLIHTYLNPGKTTFEVLFSVTFIPWIYMFLFGAITAHYTDVQKWILNKNLIGLILVFLAVYIASNILGMRWNNGIHPLGFGLMAMICFRLAFIKQNVSNILLNKNDISYGIYIYHMPLINYILYLFGKGFWQFHLSIVATIACATISWFLVERRFLRRKSFAARSN